MDIYQIICIILGVTVLLQFGLFAFVYKRYLKAQRALHNREVDNIKIKNGIRYTTDEAILTQDGDVKVSLTQRDIVLQQSTTYIANKDSNLKPGKYAVLSTHDEMETFNIRIGEYVREYKHGDSIVLGEGEKITPVSSPIILR